MSSPRHRPVITSRAVPLVLAALQRKGEDVGPLLARFGLRPELLGRRELDLPLDVVQELPEQASAQVGDPFLGLHVAMRLERGIYGLLEFCARNAPTLRQAILRLVRYSGLLDDVSEFELAERKGRAVLTQRIAGEPLCVGRHANELAVTVYVRVIREITREDWTPDRVLFAHPAPADRSELERFFGARELSFGNEYNGLELLPSDLELKITRSDQALLSVLDEQAQRLVAARPARSDLWARLREEVRVALREGAPSLDQIAARVAMSPRTLQRRLNDGETSFNDLVDGVRQELAQMYLADPALGITEVAFLLGYSELRAFTRAFKRWTGETPAQFRDARHA